MNEAAELISELRRRRFKYFVRNGKLVVQPAPDAALLDLLRARKIEILALLQGPTLTEREAEIDRMTCADGWISNASPAQALAHDLVRLCTEHQLNLHATPEGIFLEVTTANWCEVTTALEEAGYSHAV